MMEEEFDLEQIDREMRMERIRQSSSKLTWDGFGQALRRNLMEKRLVFDADSRLDVLQAIKYLKKHVPVDANAKLMEQLKQLAESLDCSFTYENNIILIKNPEIHIEIYTDQKLILQCMIGFFGRPVVDSSEAKELLDKNDFEGFRDAIDCILNVVPTASNNNDRQAFITSLELVEDLHLPYVDLSIVTHDKELDQPLGSADDPWSITRKMSVCYCLRFSVPIMISEIVWSQLKKYLARHSVVRQHINSFVYTTEFDFKSDELVLRTNFPPHILQHRYSLNIEALKDEKDVIIGELYIENIKNLDKILALLRKQQIHNTLWESVLCVTKGTWKGESSVKLKIWATPGLFEIQFSSKQSLYLVKVEQHKTTKKWSAGLYQFDGKSVSADIDDQLTSILNRSHSIPCIVVRAVSAVVASASPDPAEVHFDSSKLVSTFLDKVGNAWLPPPKRVVPDIEPVVTVQEDDSPMSLLASFKEVEDILVPIPTRPEALPRAMRLNSDQPYANAFSDLEAICQIANSWDGDVKSTTPIQSAKFDSSPAPRPVGLACSPLENAHLRMAHSLSVASSGLPSTPDVFEFSDDRSVGSGSSYPSPSPRSNPFNFSGSPNARGAGTKRRARRKAANVGDRTGSTDSNAPESNKKPRILTKPGIMDGYRARGRSSRKSSAAPSEMERPQLLRSFSNYSDYAAASFPPTPTNVQSPLVEEESDDEACDPPPPPKNLASLIAAAAAAPPPPPPVHHHPQTSLSSLLATTTAAANDPDRVRVQPSRKTSFERELLAGIRKTSNPLLAPPPSLKKPVSLVSDIYDDGLDSPPLPGSSFPTLTPSISNASIPIPAAMAAVLQQTPKMESPALLNSPKMEAPTTDKPPEATLPTKLDKMDANKLILKITKRASPSVDQQKSKLAIVQPSPLGGEKKEKVERKKKERPRDEKVKERAERVRLEPRSKKRKGDPKNEREFKRHKLSTDFPPKMDTPTLPFLQPSLPLNFKIPKKEDKDVAKEPVTPTTPLTPSLSSPSVPSLPMFSSGGSSGHTLPPMNKPNIKRNHIQSSAQIRLGLPPVQPLTYLPQSSQPSRKNSTADSSRRSSGGSSSSYAQPMPQVSSIPLPKGPIPERSYSRWPKLPPARFESPIPPSSVPLARSPSPDAVQIDDTNSPEDSLQIAEE